MDTQISGGMLGDPAVGSSECRRQTDEHNWRNIVRWADQFGIALWLTNYTMSLIKANAEGANLKSS